MEQISPVTYSLPHKTITNESIILCDFIDDGAQARQTTVHYMLIVTAGQEHEMRFQIE